MKTVRIFGAGATGDNGIDIHRIESEDDVIIEEGGELTVRPVLPGPIPGRPEVEDLEVTYARGAWIKFIYKEDTRP